MGLLTDLLDQAKKSPKRIVFPEGEDPRIVTSAIRVLKDGIASPILLGDYNRVLEMLQKFGASVDDIAVIDPATSAQSDAYASAFYELRKHKGVDLEKAQAAVVNPVIYAALMVKAGDADGTVGGAVTSTAEIVRTALQILGRAPGVESVSSFFLMILDEPHHVKQCALLFSDCALVVDPDAAQLSEIALSSAASFQALTGEVPRVAMLSFSTKGSARHDRVEKVETATKLVKAARPDLIVDGDLQFDAAFVPEIAAAKSPGSDLKGDANVLIFPSLEAGNIGYKIAQRIGGAKAIGPILQGLSKPANDLSRGCTAEDIYYLTALTSLQANLSN